MNWKRARELTFFAFFVPFWLCGIIYLTVPLTSEITGAWNTTMEGAYYDVINLCENFNDTEARCASERYLCGGINNRISTRLMVRASQCMLLLVVQFELDLFGFILTAAFVYFVGIGFVKFMILDMEHVKDGEENTSTSANPTANVPAPKHEISVA